MHETIRFNMEVAWPNLFKFVTGQILNTQLVLLDRSNLEETVC